MNASREMPRYKCHKEVWALKIKQIELAAAGDHVIVPADEGFAPFEVSDEWLRKHKPEVGGYYVVYDDGYKSFSPAKAFEEGYRLIVRHTTRPTIEELQKILDGPAPDVRIEPDGTVTQGFSDNGTG